MNANSANSATWQPPFARILGGKGGTGFVQYGIADRFFELLLISMFEMMAGWVGRHFSEEGGANFKLVYRPA